MANGKNMQEHVLNLLKSVSSERDFQNLKDLLIRENYFQARGGILHHSAFPGGLVSHSLSVMEIFKDLTKYQNIPKETIIQTALLHDLCKCRAHICKNGKWQYNPEIKDHAKLSLKILDEISYPLSKQTYKCIKYHMGPYASYELGGMYQEYSLSKYIRESNKEKAVILFHTTDLLSAHFKETRE